MKIIAKTIREALKTPGFTSLYIGGVAFTVAFTMIYAILLYGQLAPVYPEYDRSSTVYLSGIRIMSSEMTINSGYSTTFINEYLRGSLKSVSALTAKDDYPSGYPIVNTEGHGPEFHTEVRMVEPSFFDFYNYEFLAGSPFTQADFDSKLRTAVISDKISKRLFASPEEAIGKDLKMSNVKYRITGVFREASSLCIDSYGEVFIPYSIYNNESQEEFPLNLAGSLEVLMKVKPGQEKMFRKELKEICSRINSINPEGPKIRIPYIHTHTEHIFSSDYEYGQEDEKDKYSILDAKSFLSIWSPIILGLLVVLVIPALNISGLIGSRMERMASEIGIRRSFGATRVSMMRMVMNENLILTLLGGVIGLFITWILMVFAGDFLLQFMPLKYDFGNAAGEGSTFLTSEIAFAPFVFVITISVCLILNTISAWIPAYSTMHRQITNSINTKR